jgi:hypothetical protein
MEYIGKRTVRSLLALAAVAAASMGTTRSAAAEGWGCGGASGCTYSCNNISNVCKAFGCNNGTCSQSYSCGLFGYHFTCYAGGQELPTTP